LIKIKILGYLEYMIVSIARKWLDSQGNEVFNSDIPTINYMLSASSWLSFSEVTYSIESDYTVKLTGILGGIAAFSESSKYNEQYIQRIIDPSQLHQLSFSHTTNNYVIVEYSDRIELWYNGSHQLTFTYNIDAVDYRVYNDTNIGLMTLQQIDSNGIILDEVTHSTVFNSTNAILVQFTLQSNGFIHLRRAYNLGNTVLYDSRYDTPTYTVPSGNQRLYVSGKQVVSGISTSFSEYIDVIGTETLLIDD
jgi:hypothetical protein